MLDGFGVAHMGNGNAISLAKTPNFDYLVNNFPAFTLQASGPLVGLPWGEMGNSEVGHLNIGAGRIVGQDLPKITNAIQTGEFLKNPVFVEAVEHTKKYNSKLHVMGLVSTGGVHSLDEHVYALLGIAKEHQQPNVFVHMFTDGRDTEPRAALDAVKRMNERIVRIGVGSIASISGRFYGMDRGGHWAQTELVYQALVNGAGEKARSPEDCIQQNYAAQITDETIRPTVIFNPDNEPEAVISANDAVIFFNFRPDRATQLTQLFVDPAAVPEEFRHAPIENLYFATMTEYLPGLSVHVAFPKTSLHNSLGEVISNNNMTQFHIAESEKYAHVTVFFNCGRGETFPGEDRVIVDSPNNSHNYSDQPEMSAPELTRQFVEQITSGNYNFYLANFANGDMVGHTGILQSGIKAVESLDVCIRQIADVCLAADAVLIVTADHGNVEQMVNPKTGDIDKDHTTNPVPFLLIGNEFKFAQPSGRQYSSLAGEVPIGVISDIAPTILDLYGLPKPGEMTGISLFDEIR